MMAGISSPLESLHGSRSIVLLRLLFAVLLCMSGMVSIVHAQSVEQRNAAMLLLNEGQLLYEREFNIMAYTSTIPSDRVAQLQARLWSGAEKLHSNPERGYLDSLLKLLDIAPESQTLVFSRTSLNTGLIRAGNPRAIYFNEDTYVAWVPGANELEIAAMDPQLGPVFYTLAQDKNVKGDFTRQGGQCLRCHDSYTLTGGGVPRFILGSGYTYFTGSLVSHEGWILTTQETPIKFRWGGWYVTGEHGDEVHLGNIVVKTPDQLQDIEAIRKGNIDNLEDIIDTDNYLNAYSDIVALMVIEHQVDIQNIITRINYDVRRALAIAPGSTEQYDKLSSKDIPDFIKEKVETLLHAMLMIDEASLSAPISGSSGFDQIFQGKGPFDPKGRSLRELDLNNRLFRYPLSYLIYSDAFDALPLIVRLYLFERLQQILTENENSNEYENISAADRLAIHEILLATKPDYRQ